MEDVYYHDTNQAIKLHQQNYKDIKQMKLTSLLLSREKRVNFSELEASHGQFF